MNVPSPCMRVCRLDAAGVCPGCFRTVEEISRWTLMTDREKESIIAALAARRKIGPLAKERFTG